MDKTELARLVTQEVLARIKGVPTSGDGPTCTLADVCSACGRCVIAREDAVRQFMHSGASRISASRGVGKVAEDLAQKIDHTLLKPEATRFLSRKPPRSWWRTSAPRRWNTVSALSV